MKYAYNLIAYTNMSFEAISVEVGFSSFSHFIKLIKETYGTTPLKLRKKLQS
jgi:transcriptional regulator GlxA family with amidase domain